MIAELRLYFTPRLLAVLALGFASGLPLALTASTLSAWLSESGVDRAAIGLFAAVATPYAFKFMWSPLMDALPLPHLTRWLGRRRAWLLLCQALLMLGLAGMAFADPARHAWWTALFAFIAATASASQDIVIDAARVELLTPEEQGAGAAMSVLGYRFGMIASGAGALYLAEFYGWQIAYLTMAAIVPVGFITLLLTGEPARHAASSALAAAHGTPFAARAAHWLENAVIAPFADFMTRPGWLAILLFIMLYKFGDAFLGVMTNPFLLEIGFSKSQIATIVKTYGLVATIAGGFAGGWLVYKIGMMRSLWICGIAHTLTNLMFVAQARLGADEGFLAFSITLENFSGGMGTAAFVAYLSSLCNLRFTATQYALLSSLAAVGRTLFSTPAGAAVNLLGWEGFFVLATLLAVPGLAVLWWLQRRAREEMRQSIREVMVVPQSEFISEEEFYTALGEKTGKK